jgi:hypothetical protein
LTPNPTE